MLESVDESEFGMIFCSKLDDEGFSQDGPDLISMKGAKVGLKFWNEDPDIDSEFTTFVDPGIIPHVDPEIMACALDPEIMTGVGPGIGKTVWTGNMVHWWLLSWADEMLSLKWGRFSKKRKLL